MKRPNPGSPNWLWLQLGYTIQRNGSRRTILRPDGSVVDTGDGSHDAEIAAARREEQK
tara:strand:- start:21047 stop:21220 length:174 start_codon:yes stop_codon:yes gene_type:complete